ncbi:MAG: RagB/SusD family nutrient uptake outer membrane protein [Tannerellaceae bacterium]|nr:RagB/SusD family nutrient uptake outer membrane protein [Tannerellaceae bacterium]
MKRNIILLTLLAVLFSCNDLLDEENHSDTTQEFLNTPQGFIMGLNSSYQILREHYGFEEGLHGMLNVGTDEMKCSTGGNRTYDIAHYTSNYNAGSEYPRELWKKSYLILNILNFLINESENIEITTTFTEAKRIQYTGEAKFLRAFLYFHLVQQFGDVTLTTEYNTNPSLAASRHEMLDVYEVIVQDLIEASSECSPSPRQNSLESGRASAATARHLLARVYLTLGWIHDKDASHYPDNIHNKYYNASKAQEYYQKAYDTANKLLTDAPSLGLSLMPEYAYVFDEANDPPSGRNTEELFCVRFDWDLDNTYGDNHILNHLYVNGYEAFLGERNINDGRCYSWNNPTAYTLKTFNNRETDTRYNATFQTVWYATKEMISNDNDGYFTHTYTIDGQSESFLWRLTQIGDTALYYPGYEMSADEIRAKTLNRVAGENAYVIITPSGYNGASYFPTIMKYLDRTRNQYNDNSDRSILVFRLAETYLLAAEAAFKLGNNADAARHINTIRERARNKATSQAGALDIQASDVTLDFILEERTRELLLEHCRWTDLVRTGTLLERVKKYDDGFANANIQKKHQLRPIPNDQINRVVSGEPYPQNEGW